MKTSMLDLLFRVSTVSAPLVGLVAAVVLIVTQSVRSLVVLIRDARIEGGVERRFFPLVDRWRQQSFFNGCMRISLPAPDAKGNAAPSASS